MARGPLIALAGAIGALALPASAAAFSTSKVTAPADGFHATVRNDPGGLRIDVSVANPMPGDRADVHCMVLRTSSRVLVSGLDVSHGSATVTVPLDDLRAGTCQLLAVRDGTDVASADLSPYSGPLVTTDWRQTYATDKRDASGGVQYDYFVSQQQARAYGDYLGISSCGVCDTSLVYADTRRQSEYMFFGGAWLELDEPEPRSRSHARVDGHNAWGSYVARLDVDPAPLTYRQASTLQGVPPLTMTAMGTRGEDLVIDEAQDLVRCQNGDPWPVTAAGCGRFVPTGVRVERRIRQTRDGTLVHVTDVFRSTDGREHQLDLHWLNRFRDPPGDARPSHQFPWDGDEYVLHDTGRRIPAPPRAPFTLFARANHHAPDGERPWPQGAIVFDTPAGAIEYFERTDFVVPMGMTVPAGGTALVRQAFVTAPTRAEAAEVASRVEDEFAPPSIAITAPADGRVVRSPAVDVAGTASDNKGVPAVTLNGARVAVAPDGAWSGRVALAPGENTLVAVARDAVGGETVATRRVVFAPDPPPVLSRVTLSPARFRARRGARLRYTLSEPAVVRLTIQRRMRGKFRRVGVLRRRSAAGRSLMRFRGRVRGRALRPRAYRMVVRATDRAGNRSRRRTVRFRIVRAG